MAEGARTAEVFALDTWATPFLHGIASPGLDALMNALTDIGSNLVVIPIFGVVVILLLSKRRYRFALFLSIAIGGSLLLQATMKVFFARLSPQLPWAQVLSHGSFPSGHTMNAVIFYGALALILWSLFGRWIGLLAVPSPQRSHSRSVSAGSTSAITTSPMSSGESWLGSPGCS